MDRLSSCYFCGAALDATLEEHPVVPAQLHPGTDTQKTVVLCRTCQRKLDAVLDTVVDAVEASAGDLSAEVGDAESAGGDAESGDDLAATLGDDEEILTPLGEDEETGAEASETESGDDRADDEPAEAESDETSGGDDSGEDSKPKYTRSRGAGFRREEDGPVETGSLTGGAFSDDDDDEDAESESLTGDAFSDDDSTAGGDRSGSDPSSSDPSSGSSGADPSSESTSESASAGTDDSGSGAAEKRNVSMTRLENTKVMRLLENREFPVDKAEFVTVAANAYQVSRDDCEKVIDLAVEHDLLREEDGQLFAGDAA